MGAQIDNAVLRYALMMALPLTLLGVAVLAMLDRMPAALRRWSGNRLDGVAAGTRRVFLAWPLAGNLFGLSALAHVLAALALFALADGLGAPLTVWQSLGLVPAVVLISMFPLSFAGWGIREGAMVVMLGFAGVTPVMALSLSILFGVALLAASLPGLALWLAGWPHRQKTA
jgi:glycosyltransferase 2 family protein